MDDVATFDGSQLLRGALDLVILAALEQRESYGYEVARQVWSGGLVDVREASVYGTLTRLFRAGLLTVRVEPSDAGPHRKYYALSAQGQSYLAQGRQQWKTTSSAVEHLLTPSGREVSPCRPDPRHPRQCRTTWPLCATSSPT
jgi:PadR family transcriptional regulator PadR